MEPLLYYTVFIMHCINLCFVLYLSISMALLSA